MAVIIIIIIILVFQQHLKSAEKINTCAGWSFLMTSAIDSMFSELMGMADSVQEEVDGAGEDFDVMSLLHRRSYNNVQRPAFRRNPNVPVITQPWTILRLTIIIIIRKIEIWDYFSLRIIMARFMWYRAIFSLLLLFLAFSNTSNKSQAGYENQLIIIIIVMT